MPRARKTFFKTPDRTEPPGALSTAGGSWEEPLDPARRREDAGREWGGDASRSGYGPHRTGPARRINRKRPLDGDSPSALSIPPTPRPTGRRSPSPRWVHPGRKGEGPERSERPDDEQPEGTPLPAEPREPPPGRKVRAGERRLRESNLATPQAGDRHSRRCEIPEAMGTALLPSRRRIPGPARSGSDSGTRSQAIPATPPCRERASHRPCSYDCLTLKHPISDQEP